MALLSADRAEPDPRLVRAAKYLCLVYAFILAPAALPWDALGEPAILLLVPFSLLWQIGPVIAAAILVKASRTRAGQTVFFAAEAAVILFTVAAVVVLFFVQSDPKAGITMVIGVPFYEYCALLLVWVFAALLGWRARDEWR